MTLSNKELLIRAFKAGQAWNPDYPNLQNLDLASINKMDGSERDAKDLVRAFQMSDANYSGLVIATHNRPPDYDGDIGPATIALAHIRSNETEVKACPLPDFPPPVGARFHYEDPGLQKAVESMQRAAAMGSGSWPSCDPNRPNVNSFRVRIDITRCPQRVRDYLDKSLQACVEAYAEMGCALRYILATSGDCEIQKRFEGLAGGVIGWNEFPNPNTCNQTIDGRLDTDYQPSDWRYWANLECHETRHGVGANHTRGHIMNPSILLVWPLSWKGGPSEALMRRYFGGVPVPTSPGPAPSPENPPFEGEIFAEQKNGKIIIFGEQNLVLPENQPAGRYNYVVALQPNGRYKLVKKAQI